MFKSRVSNLIDSPRRYNISIKDQDTTDNFFVNNTLQLAENGIELNNNTDTIFCKQGSLRDCNV